MQNYFLFTKRSNQSIFNASEGDKMMNVNLNLIGDYYTS